RVRPQQVRPAVRNVRLRPINELRWRTDEDLVTGRVVQLRKIDVPARVVERLAPVPSPVYGGKRPAVRQVHLRQRGAAGTSGHTRPRPSVPVQATRAKTSRLCLNGQSPVRSLWSMSSGAAAV